MNSPTAAPRTIPGAGRLVLVVDDALINRSLAVMLLERAGCRAVAVDGGQAALAAVEGTRFDLILMDCQMPDLDGYEVTARIRQREKTTGGRVPILAVTGHDSPDDRARCLAAGMDECLKKPLRPQPLADVLARLLPSPAVPPPAPDPVPPPPQASTPQGSAPPYPSGRATPQAISAHRRLVMAQEGVVACLNAMPVLAVVVNRERQIVAANDMFMRAVGSTEAESVVGQRPGEAVGCIQVEHGPDGCGTAPGCAYCGVVRAVAESQRDQTRAVEEGRVMVHAGGVLELEITTTPMQVGDEVLSLVALRDIADNKRRQALERLFFHDLANGAGGIEGLASLLAHGQVPADRAPELLGLLHREAELLSEEISHQSTLARAESGDLQITRAPVHLPDLLREIGESYAHHRVAAEREIRVGPLVEITLRTDRVLLRRVVGNLVKNALEATPAGGVVTLGSRAGEGAVLCTVHNAGVLPRAVRAQMFQRSFSTKGAGRGLGTWSAKLLGERYLGGQVSFTSTAERGTEVVLALPLGGE